MLKLLMHIIATERGYIKAKRQKQVKALGGWKLEVRSWRLEVGG